MNKSMIKKLTSAALVFSVICGLSGCSSKGKHIDEVIADWGQDPSEALICKDMPGGPRVVFLFERYRDAVRHTYVGTSTDGYNSVNHYRAEGYVRRKPIFYILNDEAKVEDVQTNTWDGDSDEARQEFFDKFIRENGCFSATRTSD